MKTKTLIRILLILLISISIANCKQETNNSAEKEKAILKQTLVAMWQAIEEEDLEKYATFIHPDFTQFGENDSILSIGKEKEIKGVNMWIDQFDDIQTQMIEPRITVRDKVAWIVYYWSDSSISEGKLYSSKGKSTRIFVKENNKWLCIHGHYTLLP